MKNSLVLFLAALTFGYQVQAADLNCPLKQSEVARCSLSSIQYADGAPESFPFPVEAILCGDSLQAQQLEFFYRVSNEAPLYQGFVRDQDHYISESPLENIQLHVDKVNKQVKIIELAQGKPMTSVYSCILW